MGDSNRSNAWRNHWLIAPLLETDFKELQVLLEERTFEAGEHIITEGERGDEAFIILKGRADVISAAIASGRPLTRLEPGDHFGEQVLLTADSGVRSASVVSVEPTTVLTMKAPVIHRVLERDPESLIHLLELGTSQAQEFLLKSDDLKALFETPNKSQWRKLHSFNASDTIFSVGDEAHEVYFVVEGEIEILSLDNERLVTVGAGACFGEIGALLDLPRNAGARALTKTRLAVLSADAFREEISSRDSVKCVLQKLWRGYQFDAGYVTQFGARLSESGQRTTLIRLEGGGIGVLSRDPARSGYRARVLSTEAETLQKETISWGGNAAQPWFRVQLVPHAGHRLIRSIIATVDRPETSALYDFLINQTPLTDNMVQGLAQTGMIRALSMAPVDAICRCLNVSRAAVEQAIDDGCHTVAAVADSTGCGTVCGACKTEIAATLVRRIDYEMPTRQAAPVDQWVFRLTALDRIMMQAGPALAKVWGLFNYARPGLVSLGMVAFPVLLLIAPMSAMVLLAILAGLFIYDVALARHEWQEVFVALLENGVGIQDGEEREAGFSDQGVAGPRNVVLRQLPFWQWLKYKYTLRQDYIMNSVWRWCRHQVRSMFLSRGFEFARSWHPRAQPYWGDFARQLAELCLETSLCLGIVAVDEENDSRIGTFRFCDWLCPAGVEVEGEVLAVSMLELQVDLDRRNAVSCRLNGKSIGVGADALCYLYLALSGYHHTVLHAYANWAAVPDHPDPHVRTGAVWTLATNAVALYTGHAFQHDPRSMERVLKYNGRRGMVRHGSGPLLAVVAGESRYARFVLHARKVFMQTMVEQALEVDAEALFLMTVVHSLDHYMASICVDPYDLVPTQSGHRAAQVVRLIFSEPLEPILVDTRISAIKSGWPKALFDRLETIDADFANRIDVGIAY